MRSVSPASLTTEELIQYADLELRKGHMLPAEWQRELLYRLEKMIYGGDKLTSDPRQLSLF
jgi:hypothetical protein